VNKVIFGATFTASYNVPGSPKLSKFIIRFNNPIVGVFKNYRVFESTSSTSFGGTNITNPAIGGTVSIPATQPTVSGPVPIITVDLSAHPRDLSSGSLTYYLEVDVDHRLTDRHRP